MDKEAIARKAERKIEFEVRRVHDVGGIGIETLSGTVQSIILSALTEWEKQTSPSAETPIASEHFVVNGQKSRNLVIAPGARITLERTIKNRWSLLRMAFGRTKYAVMVFDDTITIVKPSLAPSVSEATKPEQTEEGKQ